MSGRKAIFLDRDGVLNENVYFRDTQQWEAPRRAAQFRWAIGAIPVLQKLRSAGFELVLVSNQPNIALGKATAADHAAIHGKMTEDCRRFGVNFLQFCYCFHHPRAIIAELAGPCSCRKPSAHWIEQTADQFELDLRASWMIGDRATDTASGAAAGVRTVRIGHSLWSADANATLYAQNLSHAVQQLLPSAVPLGRSTNTRPLQVGTGSSRAGHRIAVELRDRLPGEVIEILSEEP
jgi:D-glycero-D-manno-heptose 1,7-bisphosphate phosphatase